LEKLEKDGLVIREPYQIKDVIVAMETDADIELQGLMVDGGITSNGFVLQFIADLLERPVVNIGIPDVPARVLFTLQG